MIKDLFETLKNGDITLSSAESLTGGLFATTITSHPGASHYFKGSAVTYSNESKQKVLNVPELILKQYGAVSKETARYMAEGAAKLFDSSIAVSFTGNAGPDALEDKPVGLVYIGFAYGETTVLELHLKGTREEIRAKCVVIALKKIEELIKNKKIKY